MTFESVRGYIQLVSGMGELTRARAMEAAQGLLSLPAVGIATGKLAGQAGALAEELLAAATTNREHLTTLVRTEVDAAVTRLGLVPAEKLTESRAETARLRAEVATLRTASAAPIAKTAAVKSPAVRKTTVKKTAVKKTAVKKAAVKKAAVKKAAVKKAAVSQGAVSQTAAIQTAATRAGAARRPTSTAPGTSPSAGT